MKTLPATALRRDFFETLKRLAYEKEPILIERRGKAIAALVSPDSVNDLKPVARTGRLMIDPRAIADFCERHDVKRLYLFGSVMTDAFGPDSDVDVMFEPEGPSPDYFEQMRMTDELEALFARPVDLVTRNAIESSSNRFRKGSILRSARVIYAK